MQLFFTKISSSKWAFCKTKIFVQNQGMREILPQAYDWYFEDKILSIAQSLGEKIVLQMAQVTNEKLFFLLK